MTRTRALRIVARLALASGLFFFTTASSCDAGDRALGGCPEGEVCDPATEDGLHFEGPILGEGLFDPGQVKTLAIGGRQDVHVFDVDNAGHHVALTESFTPTFEGGGIAIERTQANVVTLRGTAAADGLLRILSSESGELFDRIRVAAQPIETIELAPSLVMLFQDAGDSVLYAPGAVGFVSLRGSGSSLVDEDATITGQGITQRDWDSFSIGNLGVGIHQVTVTAGDQAPVTLQLEIARATSLTGLLDGELVRGRNSFVCFGALSGTRPIHAAWDFEADNGTLEPSNFQGCVEVRPGSSDTVTVRAHADGLEVVRVFPVVDAASKRGASFKGERFINTAGDRATLR